MMTLELGGRLPTIQVGLEKCSLSRFILQIFFPGRVQGLHGGDQDRFCRVQPGHLPRQHWGLPWTLAWTWSSSVGTDPCATSLKPRLQDILTAIF